MVRHDFPCAEIERCEQGPGFARRNIEQAAPVPHAPGIRPKSVARGGERNDRGALTQRLAYAGNVCRSHVWMNATPWARRKFNNLGVDGVLVVSTRLGVTAGYGLGQARNLPGHYVEVGDL